MLTMLARMFTLLAWTLISNTQTPARADDGTTVLEGDWVRVLDGCEELPADQAAKLSTSGGGNRATRGQRVSFRGPTYTSRMFPAERCEPDFKPSGPNISEADKDCLDGRSQGILAVVDSHHFSVSALETEGDDTWGQRFMNFQFQFLTDEVLFVRPTDSNSECPDGAKRIYLIRTPVS